MVLELSSTGSKVTSEDPSVILTLAPEFLELVNSYLP